MTQNIFINEKSLMENINEYQQIFYMNRKPGNVYVPIIISLDDHITI